jgi:hypothetical protein
MKHIFFGGMCLVVLFHTGCVSNINNTKININIDNVHQTRIFPLRNSNDDITLFYIGFQAMEESGFLSEYGQAYGYYAVAVNYHNYKAPNFFILGWVNGLTLFLPSLIGFPTDLQEFELTAYLYIFDSAGTMIKTYKNSDTFTKLAGLYYGQNPNKKASQHYSILFKKMIEQANAQSDEINYLLKEAGSITNDNMQAARLKIMDFFKLNEQ